MEREYVPEVSADTETDPVKRRLKDNINAVQSRIAAACQRSGRNPAQVTLIAVTKYVGIDIIRKVIELGYLDIGESRPQELARRGSMIQEQYTRQENAGGGPLRLPFWHMIGHLQRNKVKTALQWAKLVHSVDSLRLAEQINELATSLGIRVPILMQVNTSEESSKHGVAVGAAVHMAEQMVTMPGIQLRGLMTMAPHSEDEIIVRNCFVRLRELLDEIRREPFATLEIDQLSMGMSNDFEIAIEEGATLVRVGSALFEGVDRFDRTPSPSHVTHQ